MQQDAGRWQGVRPPRSSAVPNCRQLPVASAIALLLRPDARPIGLCTRCSHSGAAPCPPPARTCSPASTSSASPPGRSSTRRCSRWPKAPGSSASCPAGTPRTCSSRTRRTGCSLSWRWASAHIDLKTLHKTLGADRLSFGKPELLMEVLGVPPAPSRRSP